MGVPFCSEGRSPSDSSPGSGPLREGPQEAAARAAPVPPPARPLLLRRHQSLARGPKALH